MSKRLFSVLLILAVLISAATVTAFAAEEELSGDGWHYYTDDVGMRLDIFTPEAYAEFKAGTLLNGEYNVDYLWLDNISINSEVTETTPIVCIGGNVSIENGGKLTFSECTVNNCGSICINGNGALIINGDFNNNGDIQASESSAVTVNGTMNNNGCIRTYDNAAFEVTGTLNNRPEAESYDGSIEVYGSGGLVLSGVSSKLNNNGCLRVSNSGSKYGDGYSQLKAKNGATIENNLVDNLQIRFGWMSFNEEGEVEDFDTWFNVYDIKNSERDFSVLIGHEFAGDWKCADVDDAAIDCVNCYYYWSENDDRVFWDGDGNLFTAEGDYEGKTLINCGAVEMSWDNENGGYLRMPEWGMAKVTVTLNNSVDGFGEAGTKGYIYVYSQLDYTGFYWENRRSEETVVEGWSCAAIPGNEFWYICQDGFDAENFDAGHIWAYIYGYENDDYFDEELEIQYNEEGNCYDFLWRGEVFMKGEVKMIENSNRFNFRLFTFRNVDADFNYTIILNINGEQRSLELHKPIIRLETGNTWYAPGDTVTVFVNSEWLPGFAGLNLDLIFDPEYLELVDDPVDFNSKLTNTGTQVNNEYNVFDSEEGRVLRVTYSNNENVYDTFNIDKNREYLFAVRFKLSEDIPADFTLDTELVIRCAPDPKTGEVDAINNVCDKDMQGLYPYFYNTCVSTMVVGDVCRDNCCNIKDAVRIAQAVVDGERYGISDVEYAACDVNDDGNVDINDIITMLQYLCGKRNQLGALD